MTREEAIERFSGIINAMSISVAQAKFYPTKAELDELCDMAIEALSADAVSRETYHNLVTASNDIDRALREYQDKEENGELVSVVQCKDCRHANECHKSVQYTRNEQNTVTIGYSPIEWCSRGERGEE